MISHRNHHMLRALSTVVTGLGLVAASTADGIAAHYAQTLQITRIFAGPTSRSHVYYRMKPYEYLVVVSSKSAAWRRVLMSNGTFGFVPCSSIAELPTVIHLKALPTMGPKGMTAATTSRELASRSGMAKYALNFIGTPYVWGGNDVNDGIDCSGFVKKMYGQIGIALPRTAAEQALVGIRITRFEDLIPGDRLYFWEAKRGKIGHTGIYLGRGYFVHSSMGHKGVATDYLSAKWQRLLVSARR